MWITIYDASSNDNNFIKIDQIDNEELSALIKILENKKISICWGDYDQEGKELLEGGILD